MRVVCGNSAAGTQHGTTSELQQHWVQNVLKFVLKFLIYLKPEMNLEVDGCPSKENLFGQSALLMNIRILFFPKVIYKFME